MANGRARAGNFLLPCQEQLLGNQLKLLNILHAIELTGLTFEFELLSKGHGQRFHGITDQVHGPYRCGLVMP